MFGTIGNIFRFFIVGACALALLFQIISTAQCNFVFKSSEEVDGTIDFGLWHMGLNSICLEETYGYGALTKSSDGLLSSARLCQTISMIAGAIAMLLVSIECLKCKILGGGKLEGIALFVAWVSGLLVYMIFGMEGCGNNFKETELQNIFDNMTAVDADPNAFSIENFNMNITGIVPSFVEDISFGTQCQWGQGASYNLIACLLYFACGVLLCCTPKPNPICGGKEEEKEVSSNKTNLSGSDADLEPQKKDAEIV